MLNKLKSWFRIIFDPTMFKYHQEYMEYNSYKPCMEYFKTDLLSDIVITFNDRCLHCNNECYLKKDNHKLESTIFNLYSRIAHLKNLGFKHKVIFAFYVNPNDYRSYIDFYKDIIIRFDKLFIADYIILYGLKKHEVKVLKSIDNIGLGVDTTPKFTKEKYCIIGG